MNQEAISIIIPCLNEEHSIQNCIENIHLACQSFERPYEIIVADNHSQDRSAELAKKSGAKVVSVAQRGYGSAVHHGILAAENDLVVFADADCSYPFDQIPQMIKPLLENKADLVLSNRLNNQMEEGAMPALHRYLGTPVLSFLIRLLYGIKVYDCNGGMRALRRSKYEQLPLKQPGMEYASEMLIRAAQAKWRYQEVAIPFRKAHTAHVPHLHTWRDGWRHLKMILSGLFTHSD